MRRREFITLFGGAAAAWPLAAYAQQSQQPRRIGVLIDLAESDPFVGARVEAFRRGLQQLGFVEGRNLRIDYRWSVADPARGRAAAEELVAIAPDVIVTLGGVSLRTVQPLTTTLPIVFLGTNDPIGGSKVDSLARPSGNATGFAAGEYGTSTKWLQLLKEIAPRMTRVAVIRNSTSPGGNAQSGAILAVAPMLAVDILPVELRDPMAVERGLAAFLRGPNDGLIVVGSSLAMLHRDMIVGLAAKYRLPAVYSSRAWTAAGGLISYGADVSQSYGLAAGYVVRILRGEKPSDLPVQLPTKYETVLNMKTARALGLEVPASVLLRADEVIE